MRRISFRRFASKSTEQQDFWCVEENVTVRYLRRHGVKTSRLSVDRNTKIVLLSIHVLLNYLKDMICDTEKVHLNSNTDLSKLYCSVVNIF